MQNTNGLPSIGKNTPPSFDPQVTEEMMDEYRCEGWETGDYCPECNSDSISTQSLELENTDDLTLGPSPARADCEDCGTVLYRHPKWIVFEIVGDEYAYKPA